MYRGYLFPPDIQPRGYLMIRRVLISLFSLLIILASVSAEIPQVINYQGKVTDTGGVPVADGDYTMTFTIYDAETSGTSPWSSGGMTVTVSGGIFSVLLGDAGQPILDLEFDDAYWLEIDIDGDIQSPRSRLGSVGYAYMASGLVAGTEVVGSVTSGTSATIKGTNTATSGNNFGVYGRSNSTDGRGVFGYAAATTGTNEGVYGESSSTSGRGVYGYATASTGTTYGVYGRSYSTEGHGVYGYATGTSGTTYGVYGRSNSTNGRGVYGHATATWGNNYGVYGESISGQGVYGYATGTSGTTYGVYGRSNSTDGRGVYGYASVGSGLTYGIYGWSASTSGRGVFGHASATSGVNYGGRFESSSTSGRGVYGYATATWGDTYGGRFESSSASGCGVYGHVVATSGTNYGVYGYSSSTDGRGVFGWTSRSTGNGQGVRGESDSSTNGVGVYGLGSSTTGQNFGVFGRTHSTDTNAYGVYYAGGLGGSGAMRTIVRTSQGPTAIEAVTATGNWIEDFGEGQLVNGRCHIDLDPLFLETVSIDERHPMHVFVQLHEPDCEGVAVDRKVKGFDVVELKNGISNVSFSYRVVAKRKGFEDSRLDYCKAAETDSYLYPELREKERLELEQERTRFKEERRLEGHRDDGVYTSATGLSLAE